jgi:hypothetical protein
VNGVTTLPDVGTLLLGAMWFAWLLADAVTDARAQVREWRRRPLAA